MKIGVEGIPDFTCPKGLVEKFADPKGCFLVRTSFVHVVSRHFCQTARTLLDLCTMENLQEQ